MSPSLSFLEDIISVEYKLNNKNNTINERINVIYNYDVVKYANLQEIMGFLPEIYIDPLLIGLEAQIRAEISKAKIKHKVELRMISNKSLRVYEDEN